MANFLNNKYGYANFVGLMMIVFAGFFNIPVFLKMFMLVVGFGLFLGTIIITIVMNFKRYNEEKKKAVSKILAGIGITIVAIPVLLIALFVVIEIVGYIANHAATEKQTKELTAYIEKSIEDATIVDTYSFTGNTSGTGNHVECESKVTFNSAMAEDEVNRIFDAKYKYRELEKKDVSYIVTVYGDAPFPDNIEGH